MHSASYTTLDAGNGYVQHFMYIRLSTHSIVKARFRTSPFRAPLSSHSFKARELNYVIRLRMLVSHHSSPLPFGCALYVAWSHRTAVPSYSPRLSLRVSSGQVTQKYLRYKHPHLGLPIKALMTVRVRRLALLTQSEAFGITFGAYTQAKSCASFGCKPGHREVNQEFG